MQCAVKNVPIINIIPVDFNN